MKLYANIEIVEALEEHEAAVMRYEAAHELMCNCSSTDGPLEHARLTRARDRAKVEREETRRAVIAAVARGGYGDPE